MRDKICDDFLLLFGVDREIFMFERFAFKKNLAPVPLRLSAPLAGRHLG